jgi:transcriptional regulator with XRE-family HTH domain
VLLFVRHARPVIILFPPAPAAVDCVVGGFLILFFPSAWSAFAADVEALIMGLSELAARPPVNGSGAALGAPCAEATVRLHRIAEVRRQQGMSLRTVGRHLNVEVRHLKQQEEATSDLRLSDLYRWQEALGVPVTDLLVESQAPLSSPVKQRAQMIKVMKTAAAIMETAETASIRRLAQTLANQLVEIMPELEGVSPWPAVGQRRSLEDYGRAAGYRLTGRFWRDL